MLRDAFLAVSMSLHSNSSFSSESGSFVVATSADIVLVRVLGLGTMNNSIPFQQFAEHLIEKGYGKFVFDLGECEGFDSTFMGIILGIRQAERLVLLVNANESHRKIFAEVGIDRVVRMVDGRISLPPVPMQKLEQKAVGSADRVRMILQAHENLVRLDERNEETFGGFVRALRAELDVGDS